METETEPAEQILSIRIDAAKLREARQREGLRLTEAAQMLGIKSRQQLWNYEKGMWDAPVDVVARMCRLYKCRIEELTTNG
jgi:predicted transcriptional regulator